MINLPSEKFSNGIYYLSRPDEFKDKKELYLKVREKEGRICTDNEVKILPRVKPGHQHYTEWQQRNLTAKKLIKYLASFSSLDILDVGSGNCWLSNLISTATENFVYASDVNKYELKQGSGVFSGSKKLKFVHGHIFDENFNGYKFDIILFSSSIQYFPDLAETIERAFVLLQAGGHIIITDSKFYNEDDLIPAKERTKKYYEELGFPEAAQNYYHHSYSDLGKFKFELIKDDSSFNKLLVKTGLKKTSPFPFIKIYKQ